MKLQQIASETYTSKLKNNVVWNESDNDKVWNRIR